MTEDEIFELLKNIRRYSHNDAEYFKGWRNALDIVEIDFREHFREKKQTPQPSRRPTPSGCLDRGSC